MDGLGTITWEKFLEDVEAIVTTSDKIGDGWELVGDKSVPGMAYISRQVKTHVPCDYPIDEPTNREDVDWLENLESGMAKDPFEAASKAERPLIVLHHVLWSISYSVPVLYFNGWKSGCNPISVEVAQKLTKNDQVLGYAEMSQAIHPIVGTPFLQLHPCKSQELLQHFSKSCNKVVSWLSAAAPAALRYKLHEDYYKLTIRTVRV
ncbi:ubiquitin-like-conjugating enzyme ATG10 isoform X2 [Athalia rosae]|uniref:ubiquitin-like-conjugating enzyme ATG10 isoform X2 n=1 Tax=Athalia rosae TaxID=37344 RepID=UPI0020336F09|nr:ubiquitin-like-conjugating enzyme ATG10 isoform X2 [Athalia rosae]